MGNTKTLEFTVKIEYKNISEDEPSLHLKDWWARNQISNLLDMAKKAGKIGHNECYIKSIDVDLVHKEKFDRLLVNYLWEQLGDIPTDDDDCIEEQFLMFSDGVPREEIWHWFEETFNLSVAEDLMYV